MDYPKFRLRIFSALHSRYILQCGSYSELPLKYCKANSTDMDGLFYNYDICAIPWNRNPPKNTKSTVLRIDTKQTPPGFAKLKFDRDNTRDIPIYFSRPPLLNEIKTGGPSIQIQKMLPREDQTFLQVSDQAIVMDQVLAVYCPYWPVEAEEWRTRKRFHRWPNEKLIARITRGGCHFVSKLRTWSSSDDTEWRFSFSKAELLLIHSWTPDQKLAHHIIRVIKRRISESCGGGESKGLQTYYFKTLMFWACEEFPPEFWTEQNIITCVKTLLLRFLWCLDEKFCPSYFIPDCNIKSHLKHEGRFDREIQALQIFLLNDICVVGNDILAQYNTFVFENSVESVYLTSMLHTFPLSEKLNRRYAQYLAECEWFLPRMRHLHAAIHAHLRLMSVDSVTERKANKDYVVCVENFEFASLNSEWFESYESLNIDKSLSENVVRILVRKLLRNSVVVYRRMSGREEAIRKTVKESHFSKLHVVTSAYRANFYFTGTQSYNESLTECEKCLEVLHNKAEVAFYYHNPSNVSSYVPLLMCNSLSQIFDEHLQVILGFATLHRNISFSNSPVTANSHKVCLKLNAWEFLKYIYIQCQRQLYSVSELTDWSSSVNSDFYRPFMSQIVANAHYSAVILFAALRQSRAYRNSLRGDLIPDHFSQTIQRMRYA